MAAHWHMGAMPEVAWECRNTGSFRAFLSLPTKSAVTAGVSNPYLSQVERGLRKPSAEILASIARGLKISAESLYEQAGILDRRSGNPDTVAAIRSDELLSERHKAVLLELYETYVREHRAAEVDNPNFPPTSRTSKESA